ncbi:hypothetical protein Tco_0674819, partial [Tanacetum coccineum]
PEFPKSKLKLDGNAAMKVAEEAAELRIMSWPYLLEILANKEKDVEDLLAICHAPDHVAPSSS